MVLRRNSGVTIPENNGTQGRVVKTWEQKYATQLWYFASSRPLSSLNKLATAMTIQWKWELGRRITGSRSSSEKFQMIAVARGIVFLKRKATLALSTSSVEA
jgi:hypothetical protein